MSFSCWLYTKFKKTCLCFIVGITVVTSKKIKDDFSHTNKRSSGNKYETLNGHSQRLGHALTSKDQKN